MGNIFSVFTPHSDPLLPVKYVSAGVGIDDDDLEEHYEKNHNDTIAGAYLWGVI